jgi:hypothetical protein
MDELSEGLEKEITENVFYCEFCGEWHAKDRQILSVYFIDEFRDDARYHSINNVIVLCPACYTKVKNNIISMDQISGSIRKRDSLAMGWINRILNNAYGKPQLETYDRRNVSSGYPIKVRGPSFFAIAIGIILAIVGVIVAINGYQGIQYYQSTLGQIDIALSDYSVQNYHNAQYMLMGGVVALAAGIGLIIGGSSKN